MFGVIKCHRCHHIWIYGGQAITTICPSCKTTVRIPKCIIPINWDFDLINGDLETAKGTAIPCIEKWDTKLGLKLIVIAMDEPIGQPFSFQYPLSSGLITRDELKSITAEKNSGRYPLPTEMKDKLIKLAFK
jgi:hypothetical protein